MRYVVGDAIEVATTDLRVALGLLEVRYLAGDPELAERLAATARQAWRAGIRHRFDDLVAATETRWQRCGEVAHRIEPEHGQYHGASHQDQCLHQIGIDHRRQTTGNGIDACRNDQNDRCCHWTPPHYTLQYHGGRVQMDGDLGKDVGNH